MVIVTQNQYLLASKIHHITMDEQVNYQEVRGANGKQKTIADRYYQITIIYSPESVTNSNGNQIRSSDEQRECSVIIRGAVDAHKVFHDLIQQIREQMPDQLFLDKALERMIANADFDLIEKADKRKKDDLDSLFELRKLFGGTVNDRSTKKVRKPRKAKRRSKKVLRKSKARR